MWSRRPRSSERHSWTKTLARSMSSVTTPTWARTSEIRGTPARQKRQDATERAAAGAAPTGGAAGRDQVAARAEDERARIGPLDGVGGGLEAGRRPLDDRPQDFL